MKIFKYLMLGLLATSAMVPAINAMEVAGYEQFSTEELEFRRLFISCVSGVQNFLEDRLENLPNYIAQRWRAKPIVIETKINVGLSEAIKKGEKQLHQALQTVPQVDEGRTLRLYRALTSRASEIYQSLFTRADNVESYGFGYTSKPKIMRGLHRYFDIVLGIPEEELEAKKYLASFTLALTLRSESQHLRALNGFLTVYLNGEGSSSLLAYLRNERVSRDQTNQRELADLNTYGQILGAMTAEYQFLEAVCPSDYVCAYVFYPENRLIEMAGKKLDPEKEYQSFLKQVNTKDILFAARVKANHENLDALVIGPPVAASEYDYPPFQSLGVTATVTSAVADEDLSQGKMAVAAVAEPIAAPPPPPKVVELFSPHEKEEIDNVKGVVEALRTAQEADYKIAASGGRRVGYSPAEQIIAYANDQVISSKFRRVVSELLADQIRLRGLASSILTVEKAGTAKSCNAAASVMADWIRERITKDGLAVDVEGVLTGIGHLKNRSDAESRQEKLVPRNHSDLFNTMFVLRAVSTHYDALTEQQVGREVKDAIQNLLAESLNMIHDHGETNACAAGAKGRNFLMQFNIIKFFKDYHPTKLA